MSSVAVRTRAAEHHARRGTDVYPVAVASVASFCLLTTLAITLVGPRWESPVLDLPLWAYLLGGAGGLLTVVLYPGWARRLGSRNRGKVVVFTFYRLGCALAMGGFGYSTLIWMGDGLGLVTPTWFQYAFALISGLAEALANEVVLRGLGFLAPRQIDPRLL